MSLKELTSKITNFAKKCKVEPTKVAVTATYGCFVLVCEIPPKESLMADYKERLKAYNEAYSVYKVEMEKFRRADTIAKVKAKKAKVQTEAANKLKKLEKERLALLEKINNG